MKLTATLLLPGVDDPRNNPYAPVFFIVHDAAGRILRSGQCDRASLGMQHAPGEFWTEADKYYAPHAHRVCPITKQVLPVEPAE